MSLGQIARAGLALVIGFAVGLAGLTFVAGDRDRPPGGQARQVQFQPTLSLIRQAATGQLVSLQVAPFEVGQNDFRVTMLSPLGGQPLDVGHVELAVSSLESGEVVSQVRALVAQSSGEGAFSLPHQGWWNIEVVVDGSSSAAFTLKLEQPSDAPDSFAPPDYASDPAAEGLFRATVERYEGLAGLQWREELTSGHAGPSGFGVWFITNIDGNREGYHARTLNMDEGGSELYSDTNRQCFRQASEAWQCSDGPSPIGSFELSYLYQATAFKPGRQEVVDGEMTQVIFFYSPSQRAWYAWWVGEETQYLRRQVMLATGHFMLDQYTAHDIPAEIEPEDLDLQTR